MLPIIKLLLVVIIKCIWIYFLYQNRENKSKKNSGAKLFEKEKHFSLIFRGAKLFERSVVFLIYTHFFQFK
jgi:hypothetical protein